MTGRLFQPAPNSNQTQAQPAADAAWFIHDRFGLFIHWGIYSAAARHEWVKNYECIMLQIDPGQKASYTTMGGQEGVLTLELPVQKPDVAVPVIELFLKEG